MEDEELVDFELEEDGYQQIWVSTSNITYAQLTDGSEARVVTTPINVLRVEPRI